VLPYTPGLRPNGWWELQAIAGFRAGDPTPRGDWALNAPRDTPAYELGAWVSQVLGRPVSLQPDMCTLRLPSPLAALGNGPNMPLYWVMPA
jgi:hypothetical protein